MSRQGDDLAAAEAGRAAAEAGAIGGDPGPGPDHDPADQPVREAGGGEAEGFEEAEQALIDHAEHGDLGHSPRNDAFPAEAESDRATAAYGESDQERVSEVDEDAVERS
jgi:hypothetical protein